MASHALGIITLLVLILVLGLAWIAEHTKVFGRLGRHIETLSYSLTWFFHMIPAFTETSTRIPSVRPGPLPPEDPGLKAAIGMAILAFLIGATAQVVRMRRTPSAVRA